MKVEFGQTIWDIGNVLGNTLGTEKKQKTLPLSLLIECTKFIFAKWFLTYYDGLFHNVWQGWGTISMFQKQKL
jgi:hypothetical protein